MCSYVLTATYIVINGYSNIFGLELILDQYLTRVNPMHTSRANSSCPLATPTITLDTFYRKGASREPCSQRVTMGINLP